MTDLPDIDLLVTAADNPDQIAPPAAKEVRPVRVVTRLHERGETVCSSNVYELVAEAIKVKAKSYLQQVRACVSNDRLHIETAFGQPPATIIGSAKRLNVNLVVIASRGQSGIRQRLYVGVTERILRGAPCAILVIRAQGPIHEVDRVRMKGV